MDESDNKFVEAAIYGSVITFTYNIRDFTNRDLLKHGWDVMTPLELMTRVRHGELSMATLSLRMRDDLKEKARQMASDQGVSLNSYINATLAATTAQQETLVLLGDRLREIDQDRLHARVMKFMSKPRTGTEPTPEEIERARSAKQ